jgi:hypothetical protein
VRESLAHTHITVDHRSKSKFNWQRGNAIQNFSCYCMGSSKKKIKEKEDDALTKIFKTKTRSTR